MQYNASDYQLIVLDINRKDIESFDHLSILSELDRFKEIALEFEGKLSFFVSGYEKDPRELWEIEDVRRYFDFLDRAFPYWFFFLTKKIEKGHAPINILMALLITIENQAKTNAEKKEIVFEKKSLQNFLDIHFHFLNELTDKLNLPIEENKRISEEIIENII